MVAGQAAATQIVRQEAERLRILHLGERVENGNGVRAQSKPRPRVRAAGGDDDAVHALRQELLDMLALAVGIVRPTAQKDRHARVFERVLDAFQDRNAEAAVTVGGDQADCEGAPAQQALRQMGFELYRTPVGDKYVVAGMRQTGARLGGEQSGHIVFLNHHTTGDGLLTAVQLLNVIAARQLPLATLAQILHKFPQILLNIKIRERCDPLDLPQVRQVVQEAENSLGHEGRVVVRLSGTESVARVMIEGPEENLIASLAHRIGQAITRALDGSAYDESPTLAKE